MGPYNLSQILQPMSPDEFVDSTYGKSYRLFPGMPGKFTSLLPWSRFNTLLEEHAFDPERLHIVKERSVVPAPTYRGHDAAGQLTRHLDPVKVNKLLREGATLVVNSVEEMVEPVRELAESLQRSLYKRIAITAFASWGTTAGFGLQPHGDECDVIIIQVAGKKRWLLYGDAPEPPSYHYQNGAEIPNPTWDHILEDGDVLYIPRGWQHAAAPVDEPSLHLTVVCHNNTGVDFLGWLQDELRVNPVVQQELPRFGSPEQRAQHMASLRAEILSLLDANGLERYFLMSDAAAQPHPRFSLPWSVMPGALPPSDGAMVRFTSPRRITVRKGTDPQTIDLWANGERWQFSSQVNDLIHVLLDGKPHSIGELCAAGGALDHGRVRDFLGELLLQGLIAVAAPQCLPLELDQAAD